MEKWHPEGDYELIAVVKGFFFIHILGPILLILVFILLPIVTIVVWAFLLLVNPKWLINNRLENCHRIYSSDHDFEIDWISTFTDIDFWIFYLDWS